MTSRAAANFLRMVAPCSTRTGNYRSFSCGWSIRNEFFCCARRVTFSGLPLLLDRQSCDADRILHHRLQQQQQRREQSRTRWASGWITWQSAGRLNGNVGGRWLDVTVTAATGRPCLRMTALASFDVPQQVPVLLRLRLLRCRSSGEVASSL